MNFIQLLKETGRIPNKFESLNGQKGELFTYQKVNGQFSAMIVLLENDLPKEILGSAIGNTMNEAHDKLRDSILNAEKCLHQNVDRKDGLDECLDCGTKNY